MNRSEEMHKREVEQLAKAHAKTRNDCPCKYCVEMRADHHTHLCPDWDFMLVDDTTIEFEACLCFTTPA